MRLAVRLRPRKKSVRNGLSAGAEWIRTSSSAPDRDDFEHASIGILFFEKVVPSFDPQLAFFVPDLDRQFEIAIPEVSLSQRLPAVLLRLIAVTHTHLGAGAAMAQPFFSCEPNAHNFQW
jgi:hypothetical protein